MRPWPWTIDADGVGQFFATKAQAVAAVAALQAQAAQLQAQANGSDFPTATIPQWGTCDADNSVIAYLQDQLATTNLDYQQTVIDQRALYDLGVNLKQRGC